MGSRLSTLVSRSFQSVRPESSSILVRVYIDPTIVLFSTKIDDAVIESLESLAEDRFSLPFLMEVRPPGEFSFDAAKGKLATLRFENDDVPQVNFIVPGDLNLLGEESLKSAPGQQGRLLRLAGLIDLESRLTVRYPPSILYQDVMRCSNSPDVIRSFDEPC